MATEETKTFIDKSWDEEVVPLMEKYIKIENQSPNFDKEWEKNGLIDDAAKLLHQWAKTRQDKIPGLEVEIVRLPQKTPIIFGTLAGTDDKAGTILMYGHYDKQPPLTSAWREGLHPYQPVMIDGKLYGRGGADDGYSTCAAILAIEALHRQKIPHARIVFMIEGSEESGSIHLESYVSHLKEKIGDVNLVICLDSGCGNYEQLWITTSLRGILAGVLSVQILKEASHSGQASGVVPSSFRILRQLLNRIEDVNTGEILIDELKVKIPEERMEQIKKCANSLGENIFNDYKFVEGAGPVNKKDIVDSIIHRTWLPALSVIGIDGIPSLTECGNVVRTHTDVKLSIRIPPGVDSNKGAQIVKEILEKDPPYGSKVVFTPQHPTNGWESPKLDEWLEKAMNDASNYFFKKPTNFVGEGGTIPFMGMLGQQFPKAQFVITGVLGPQSNAHGPNEFLHIDMGKKVTSCVSSIVADHYKHRTK